MLLTSHFCEERTAASAPKRWTPANTWENESPDVVVFKRQWLSKARDAGSVSKVWCEPRTFKNVSEYLQDTGGKYMPSPQRYWTIVDCSIGLTVDKRSIFNIRAARQRSERGCETWEKKKGSNIPPRCIDVSIGIIKDYQQIFWR